MSGQGQSQAGGSDTTFNLIDAPWIPILRRDGMVQRVGIRKALTEAGSIRQIAASNPMDNVALLRFLLAVLYWCKGDPPGPGEKDKILAGGQFSPDWFVMPARRNLLSSHGHGKGGTNA